MQNWFINSQSIIHDDPISLLASKWINRMISYTLDLEPNWTWLQLSFDWILTPTWEGVKVVRIFQESILRGKFLNYLHYSLPKICQKQLNLQMFISYSEKIFFSFAKVRNLWDLEICFANNKLCLRISILLLYLAAVKSLPVAEINF